MRVLAVPLLTAVCFAQNNNNPYSPSPGTKDKGSAAKKLDIQPTTAKTAFVLNTADPKEIFEPTVIEIGTRDESAKARPITETYKIGAGDVLLIDLRNSSHGSGHYKVGPDGTIDYPLAQGRIAVANETEEYVAELLAKNIKLYSSPAVTVKVAQYLSHVITVKGLADNIGVRNLRREAMPLFALRAEAGVHRAATKAIVTRSGDTAPEIFDLTDRSLDDVLIRPGDTVEFAAAETKVSAVGHYYLAGLVVSGGRRELAQGTTMLRAIGAGGGVRSNAYKAVIRRVNEQKVITLSEYDLRAIRSGKAVDPVLQPGDVVEIIE